MTEMEPGRIRGTFESNGTTYLPPIEFCGCLMDPCPHYRPASSMLDGAHIGNGTSQHGPTWCPVHGCVGSECMDRHEPVLLPSVQFADPATLPPAKLEFRYSVCHVDQRPDFGGGVVQADPTQSGWLIIDHWSKPLLKDGLPPVLKFIGYLKTDTGEAAMLEAHAEVSAMNGLPENRRLRVPLEESGA